jgi:hypothetical protein
MDKPMIDCIPLGQHQQVTRASHEELSDNHVLRSGKLAQIKKGGQGRPGQRNHVGIVCDFGWLQSALRVTCAGCRARELVYLYQYSREALMCFVPVEGKDETYRHVHSKFIVTIPSDPKKLAVLAETLGIPPKHFAYFGRGKILIVNDQGRGAAKKKKK